MQGFASTREDRIATEINVIAHEAEAELKQLRNRYIVAMTSRTGPSSFYYLRRMQITLYNAGNKMQAVEDHWLRRPR